MIYTTYPQFVTQTRFVCTLQQARPKLFTDRKRSIHNCPCQKLNILRNANPFPIRNLQL